MKVEYINPFISSTINVFDTMIGIKPEKRSIYIKKEEYMPFDVSGIIGVAGKMSGHIVISFPEELALKIVGMFLGEERTTISRDVVDAVGEFVNMIAGSAKRILAEKGLKYNIGLPNVVSGKNHIIFRQSSIVAIGVKFSADDYIFAIEVALLEAVES